MTLKGYRKDKYILVVKYSFRRIQGNRPKRKEEVIYYSQHLRFGEEFKEYIFVNCFGIHD